MSGTLEMRSGRSQEGKSREFELDAKSFAAMLDVLNHTAPDVDFDHQEESRRGLSPNWSQAVESEMVVTGAIIDSWVEPSRTANDSARLVLQVAPKGHPKELVIVEARTSLVPDRGWLEDLGENLCHGSPVLAIGRRMINGFLAATCLQLIR
jgi:hypothetical protein